MPEMRQLSVEVFRDYNYPEIDVQPADDGIEKINRIVQGIEIVRKTRLFKLPSWADGSIDMEKIDWPVFPADLNLVLTKTPLSPTESSLTVISGMALSGNKVYSPRVAVVDMSYEWTPQVVAHETGHLLGLKQRGSTHDGEGHCRNAHCLMHYKDDRTNIVEKVRPKSISRLLKRNIAHEHITAVESSQQNFCAECRHQLAVNAFMLAKAKAGNFVPSDLLL